MKKDNVKNENIEIVNKDANGNVISTAFPVSDRTKKDQSKTSVIYTLIAVLLHIIAFVPIIAVPIVLAVKCYQLAPYYSFWHFVGLIISIVFAVIYAVVIFCVTRKNTKSNIAMQTVKIAITFTCLTTVFAMILTYAVPDIIAMATQHTLYAEDVYYNGEAQAEKNLKLDRDFIMYNLMNGNLNNYNDENGDFSYTTLSKHEKAPDGTHKEYKNAEINSAYTDYMNYGDVSRLQAEVIDVMKETQPRKYDLYEFIYNTYVLNDFDYAFFNTIGRRAFTLAIVDYEYNHANYEGLLKEGFSNKKIKQLFDTNFDNFNHDGYQTFDDPMLLYAQMPGRMTVPVVLRLILNEGWSYTQGAYDDNGNLQFTEDGNFLYELYDPEARDAFVKENGEGGFKYTGTLLGVDGKEYEAKYGFNKDGWMVYENGVVKRPIKWLVLDMLGDPMDLVSLDVFGMLSGLLNGMDLGDLISGILPKLSNLISSLGGLLQEDVAELIRFATGGANLNVNLCLNDANELAISISPMNAEYGMLGYMQASWVQSNNLLMAVINLLGIRNWLSIFGAVGVVLVIAAGVIRECAKKTRMRTAVSRDRIARGITAERINNGEFNPDELDEHKILADDLTLEDIEAIEFAQKNKTSKPSVKGKKKIEDIDLDNIDDLNLDDINLDDLDLEGLDLDDELLKEDKPKKKKDKKKDKKKSDDLDDLDIDNIDLDNIDLDSIDLNNIDLNETETVSESEPAMKEAEAPAEKSKKKKDKKKDKKKEDDLDDLDLDGIDLDNLDDLDIEGIDLGDDDLLDSKSKKKKK